MVLLGRRQRTHSLGLGFCLCAVPVTCKERRREGRAGRQAHSTDTDSSSPTGRPALPTMASRCFFPRDAAAADHPQSKAAAAQALERLHHGGRLLSREDVGGAVRVKIVVSKRELKQMVAALGDGGLVAAASSERHRQRAAAAAGPGAEQRLQSLRRRSVRRAAEAAARRMQAGGEWEPGLQSIPEEVC
jgi:hypothetical protein